MQLTNKNVYLGRQEYLFSIADLYQVAKALPSNRNKMLSEKVFHEVVIRLLAKAAAEPALHVVYHYDEPRNRHYTNVNGLILSISAAKPEVRRDYMDAIKLVITTPLLLDQNNRILAVEYMKHNGAGLITKEAADRLLTDVSGIEKLSEMARTRIQLSDTDEISTVPETVTLSAPPTEMLSVETP